MDQDTLIAALQYGGPVITAAVAWFGARTRYLAQASQVVEARLDKILLQVQDLNTRLLEMSEENGRLRAENAEISEKWRSLNIHYSQLKKERR